MRTPWKVVKWTGVGLVTLFAVLLIAVAVLNWRANTRLEERIAAIRAAGDPVALSDLAREPIPAEQNAATYLRRAEKGIEALSKEFEALYAQESLYYEGERLNKEGAELLRTSFAAYPDVLPLIEQAAACPDYDSQLDYTLDASEFLNDMIGKGVRHKRAAARILKHQADLLLFVRQREDAVKAGVHIMRLGRLFDRDPTMVNYLVAIAIRGIGADGINRALNDGPVSTAVRQLLEEELEQHDAMEGYQRCLKTERAFGISHLQWTFGKMRRVAWTFKDDECDYLDLVEQELRIGPQPRFKVAPQIRELRQQLPSWGPLTQNIFPALERAREAVDRTRAYLRCLRVLNAWQAYVEKNGAEPSSLSDLGLPQEAAVDPYSGNHLLTTKTPDGLIIYSAGKDGVDDGGHLDEFKDVGVGPWAGP